MYEPPLQHHFEDMEKQEHAAKLGMWIFLGSELLFFNALFALYSFYRTDHPEIFREGIRLNAKWLGTINTAVLVAGSVSVASAHNFLRMGRRNLSIGLTLLTALAGLAYVIIKSVEYGMHFREGIYPGGMGSFFVENPDPAYAAFFTTYFATTGLHLIHVAAGAVLFTWMAWWIHRDRVGPSGAYRLGIAALYWHFVDIIWLFLWPMFYLLGAHG
ncbi:cytochrome c oxidase subunit 3 [Vulgatibacter incomptus]|uniref:Cytochrome c oxidase polypeptide III n=1 Tax=Vulgatibacter incomptus TaxID=1391653 RepID=A0A0K1PAW3_9BACT|nr:cytochrome c oxidase subunit 3 [Vulgatibacter incomptus]AKU90244.1 Cytochrome c oxidase polypeptide III [Vulgatibacter incomptus]